MTLNPICKCGNVKAQPEHAQCTHCSINFKKSLSNIYYELHRKDAHHSRTTKLKLLGAMRDVLQEALPETKTANEGQGANHV